MSVTASEQLSISGRSGRSFSFGSFTVVNNPSAISATTFGTGRAGALTVNTPRLTMFDGGIISTRLVVTARLVPLPSMRAV